MLHSTTTPAAEVIRVSVVGKVVTYPALFAEYGDHLANEGGELRSLHSFLQWARTARKTAPEWMTEFVAWAWMDDSGLAYRVSTRDGRHHTVEGASPAASGELLGLYHA